MKVFRSTPMFWNARWAVTEMPRTVACNKVVRCRVVFAETFKIAELEVSKRAPCGCPVVVLGVPEVEM
jgi:hypothetical protein